MNLTRVWVISDFYRYNVFTRASACYTHCVIVIKFSKTERLNAKEVIIIIIHTVGIFKPMPNEISYIQPTLPITNNNREYDSQKCYGHGGRSYSVGRELINIVFSFTQYININRPDLTYRYAFRLKQFRPFTFYK